MTLEEYLREAATPPPELRLGQHHVVVLSRVRPDLASTLTAADPWDPFYDDARLPAFRDWLVARWDGGR